MAAGTDRDHAKFVRRARADNSYFEVHRDGRGLDQANTMAEVGRENFIRAPRSSSGTLDGVNAEIENLVKEAWEGG
jgi:hypothetical protein